jgi:hypothetical protein
MTAPQEIHNGVRALHAFVEKFGKLPAPWNAQDASQLITLAKSINDASKNKLEQVNEQLLRQLAYTSQGSIVGLTAFVGGIAAQECLKALSGKYTPLKQWVRSLNLM